MAIRALPLYLSLINLNLTREFMYLVNRSLAIVLLFLFVGKVAVVEAYTELEDGLLENAASEIPYVGPVIGPIVGLLFSQILSSQCAFFGVLLSRYAAPSMCRSLGVLLPQ